MNCPKSAHIINTFYVDGISLFIDVYEGNRPITLAFSQYLVLRRTNKESNLNVVIGYPDVEMRIFSRSLIALFTY